MCNGLFKKTTTKKTFKKTCKVNNSVNLVFICHWEVNEYEMLDVTIINSLEKKYNVKHVVWKVTVMHNNVQEWPKRKKILTCKMNNHSLFGSLTPWL